jgi:pimeloyl-ACP methyl ester carboxylesterase
LFSLPATILPEHYSFQRFHFTDNEQLFLFNRFCRYSSWGCAVRPVFFGTGSHRLFGVYHTPLQLEPFSQSIILCPSFGQEYIRSYYIIRQLAEQLAKAGHHVLRFDWYGSGDSYGEPENANIDIWVRDIQYAIEELLSTSGAEKVSLVGLRMGAGVALTAAKTIQSIETIILWDPVVSGKDWLTETKGLHTALVNRFAIVQQVSSAFEILGFSFPPQLQKEFERIDFTGEPLPLSSKIHLIISDTCQGYKQLVQTFKLVKSCQSTEVISTQNFWNDFRLSDRVIMSHPATGPILRRFSEKAS